MHESVETVLVAPENLATGMFVILDLSWLEHPFAFNRFRIQTEDQIAALRALSLPHYVIDPVRSAPGVFAPPPAETVDPPPAAATDAAADPDRRRRIEHNRAFRSSIAAAERTAAKAAQTVRQATRQFVSRPAESIVATDTLVREIAEALLGHSDVMIHLLADKTAGEDAYFHSLNVAMLALLLGKALGMDAETLRVIGLAAVFHDIGKEDMPSRVLLKTEPLTRAEETLLRGHPTVGADLAARGQMPAPVVAAIRQHHENLDGSGYPGGVAGDGISAAARVVAIVNHYDNLCNPLNVNKAMTPYEALSTMFAKRKGWFDPAMLGKLVHVLGVYPPGSLVQLSNGATAMVVSVNSAKPLQPVVVLYDAKVPKEEAIILDLAGAPELGISKALRPAALAPAVYEYLSPRRRVTYYFGTETPAP